MALASSCSQFGFWMSSTRTILSPLWIPAFSAGVFGFTHPTTAGSSRSAGVFVMQHVDAGEQGDGEHDVHRRSRQGDEKALPPRMREKLPRIAGAVVHRVLARHLHVTTQRNSADAIVGIAFFEAQQPLAKADGKHFHPDAEILGDGEVAELMNQDHESEHDSHDEDGVKDGQKLRHHSLDYSKVLIAKWPRWAIPCGGVASPFLLPKGGPRYPEQAPSV